MKILSALLTTAVLVGCASIPAAPNQLDEDPQAGTIVFYRTARGFGYGQRSDILLNDRLAARSVPGEKFVVRASPGEHVVRVPNWMYAGEQRIKIVVRTGETVYVRTATGAASFGGVFDVDVIERREAELELVNLGGTKR